LEEISGGMRGRMEEDVVDEYAGAWEVRISPIVITLNGRNHIGSRLITRGEV
jgi:hypothetical protein